MAKKMRWQIEQFVFCERQQTLTNSEKVEQLEPIVVELLTYFCRHNDQIINRDQLIEQVWLGRVITDNAVSKVITKLRKIFNDDAKKPQFIATFPKKGYKFIASVTQVIEQPTQTVVTQQAEIETPVVQVTYGKSSQLYLILVASIILVALVSYWQVNRVQPPITEVKALTRDPGRESRPQISPNGKYLAYVEVRDKKMRQWIKSLSDETRIEVSHGEASNIWVDSVSWNNEGTQFVYLVTTPDSCGYFIREFNAMTLGEAKLIHNCPNGSYGKIAYTHDNNRLVYTENEGSNTPFTLFEINLKDNEKRKLNQPEIFLGGNSQFDLHPTQNKLLISSPDKQQWEGFYSLDLETNELILLFKQDAYICCGRWSHSGKRVVLMGEHPATQIVSFDLQGNDRRIIYTGSEQVRVPERHNNGKDYLFSIVQLNQNADYFNLTTNLRNDIAHSSVDDSLATFAYHSNQIAYVGVGSGSEEIWLTDNSGKQRKKLTQFNDSRHYIELLWSSSGDYLLGLALNEIHLIDSKTGQSETLKIPQVEIRGVSWKDNKTISYSTKLKNGWRVSYYDIRTDIKTQEKENWSYISYAKNPDDMLWLDQKNKLFFGVDKVMITDKEILEIGLLNGRTFNLKKRGSTWAWQKRAKGKYQLMLKQQLNKLAKVLLTTDSYHFDLSPHGVLYHTLESLNADIYKTVSDK